MTEKEEKLWSMGRRSAWLALLQKALGELGYEPSSEKATIELAKRVSEREQAIAKLRELCYDFGDNDWPDALHLADIIDKHLGRVLHAERSKRNRR